ETEQFIKDTGLKKLYHPTIQLNNGRMCIDLLDTPTPEVASILEKMGTAFDLAYKRFEDLQKAEAQAREAQIELGLERVRARAMAMHNSDELKELIGTLFTELTKLDLVLTRCVIMIYDSDVNTSRWWMANSEDPENPNGFYIKQHEHPPIVAYFKGWRERQLKWSYVLEGQVKKDWDVFLFNETELKFLPDFVIEGMKAPDKVYLNASFNNFGNLTLATLEPLSDEHFDILLRFAKVFDLTYTRFNDLQKAEAQAREAQIEVALERVRAKTMAMHTSEELANVATVMFDQMRILGGDLFSFGIVLCDKHENMVEQWHSIPHAGMLAPFFVPVDLDYIHRYRYDQWKAGVELFSVVIPEDYIAHHFGLMLDLPSVKAVWEGIAAKGIPLPPIPTWEIDYGASFKYGYLLVSALKPFEDDKIFPRFAKVFEQAYTRFLDLQKAEAQAREAQIEAALERVRASAMAMHKSDDLKSAVATVFEELDKLNLGLIRCGIAILDKEKPRSDIWITIKSNEGSAIQVAGDEPLDIHPLLKGTYDAWRKQEDFSYVLQDDDLLSYYQAITKTNFQLPISASLNTENKDQHQYFFNAVFQDGSLFAFLNTAFTDEAKTVMKRFANVFNLTYKRFLDLQKAEAQAREAHIEAALERVRASAMAMHKSEDLHSAVKIMFEEFQKLNLDVLRCGVGILNKDSRTGTVWATSVSENDLSVQISANESFDTHPLMMLIYEHWQKQEDLSYVLEGQDLVNYYKAMEASELKLPNSQILFSEDQLQPQYYYAAMFTAGGLYAFTDTPLAPGDKKLMNRFAAVLNLTYNRFLDLQKAEAQAREAQIEAALERVRSKTMAMQRAEELDSVIKTIYSELKRLDVSFERCFIMIFDEKKGATWWMGSPDDDLFHDGFYVQYHTHPPHLAYLKGWEERQQKWEYRLEGQIKKDWDEFIFNKTELSKLPPIVIEYMKSFEFAHLAASFENFGCMTTGGRERLSEESYGILSRFAKVFDQTYTRFNDLKQAEAQAREAQIELGLERVRARAMAMQKSHELKELIVTLSIELSKLDIILDRCFIITYDIQTMGSTWWMSNPDMPSEGLGLFVKYHEHSPYLAHINAWKERKVKWQYILEGEVKKTWDKFLFVETELSQLPHFVIEN
ncbi:MAG TPA: hypothetical protein VNA26_06370, partial [Chitinophagaceae bacterium]|nr:hypothetical protein [Chitinophagaceae bacterium]